MLVNANICIECKRTLDNGARVLRLFWLQIVTDEELKLIVNSLSQIYDEIVVVYL